MGRVCLKHQEFYETECRWCEPARGFEKGVGQFAGYDILPVAPMPPIRPVPSNADAAYMASPEYKALAAEFGQPPRPPRPQVHGLRAALSAAWDEGIARNAWNAALDAAVAAGAIDGQLIMSLKK